MAHVALILYIGNVDQTSDVLYFSFIKYVLLYIYI